MMVQVFGLHGSLGLDNNYNKENKMANTKPKSSQVIYGKNSSPTVENALDALQPALAMAKTFTAVPAEFQSWVILVTQPHLRQMVWSIAKNKYVRAPWHPVGKAGYFLRQVGEGFLQVRGDVVLQTTDFPDLAEYLSVTGPTFVLDEARGEFIRNADSGRGKDAGRVVGSHQEDAIRNIVGRSGTTTFPGTTTFTGAFSAGADIPQNVLGTISYPTKSLMFDASLVVPTAAENRPTNRAYIFAVTY